MIYFILFTEGLILGSFVNALVWRLMIRDKDISKRPKLDSNDASIIKGRSMCVSCKHVLRADDLVPVVSWLALRGRCRYCKARISWQYPVVELTCALLFLISYRFWPEALDNYADWFSFSNWLILIVLMLSITVYDLRWMLIPNSLIVIMLVLTAAEIVLKLALGDAGLTDLKDVGIGLLLGFGAFLLLHGLSRGKWLGGGDVKLSFWMSLYLGSHVVMAIMIGFYSAAIFILPLVVTKIATRKSNIPFGPFLLGGVFITKLFYSPISDFIKSLMGI